MAKVKKKLNPDKPTLLEFVGFCQAYHKATGKNVASFRMKDVMKVVRAWRRGVNNK